MLLAGLMLAAGPVWAGLEVEVDRSRLYQDERLELTVRADPDTARYPLDLTALDTLFVIEQQSQGQRLRRSDNGDIQPWREWHLWLRPRHVGTLAIPVFRMGNQRSERLLVEVLDPSQRSDELPADAVRLDVQLAEREVYIGQPMLLTIDLWYQLRMNGEYNALNFGDFSAELLDESNITDYQNGRQVRRYRLQYRLTAERTGTLQLPPIRFVGQYQFGPFGERRTVERTQPAQQVTVKPIPASYPADAIWLPAKRLRLSDNLPASLQLTAHQHQNWTVTTEVDGLPPTRLPDPLADLSGESWRLYRDAPEFDDRQRRDLAALVFTEPGQQQLPEIRLPWWDLQHDRLAYAQLPARTIAVQAESSPVFQPTPTPSTSEAQRIAPLASVWPWLTLGLLLLVLAMAGGWWRHRRRPARPLPSTPPVIQWQEKTLLALDDAREFRAALLVWLQQQGRHPQRSLAALSGAPAAIWARLNAALYGPRAKRAPNRAERKALVRALRKTPSKPAADNDPTRLYPD